MTLIDNALNPEEHIIWRGNPQQPPLSVTVNIIRCVALIVMALFILILTRAPSSPLYKLIEPNIRGFIVILMIVCIYKFIRSLFVYNPDKIAEYAITDQRVIIAHNALLSRTRAFTLNAINSITAEKNIVNKKQQIVFGEYRRVGLINCLVTSSELGKKNSPPPTFTDMANAEEALKILGAKAVNARIYGAQVDKTSDFTATVVMTDTEQEQNALNHASLESMIESDETILWRASSTGLIGGAHSRTSALIISISVFLFMLLISAATKDQYPHLSYYKMHLFTTTAAAGLYALYTLARYLKKDPDLGMADEYIVKTVELCSVV